MNLYIFYFDYLFTKKRVYSITVDNLYLPSRSYSAYSQRYQKKFDEIQNSVSAYTNIHYLRVNDQLTIGDITGKVIGPVNPVDYMTKR